MAVSYDWLQLGSYSDIVFLLRNKALGAMVSEAFFGVFLNLVNHITYQGMEIPVVLLDNDTYLMLSH